MKRLIIFAMSLLFAVAVQAEENKTATEPKVAESKTESTPAAVEAKPVQEFLLPKFRKDWYFQRYRDWVIDNITYPESCIDEGIEGRVVVVFVIDADGMIRIAEAVQTPDKRLSDELIRVIKSEKWYRSAMKWNPERNKYEAVPMRSMIPLNFSIPPKKKGNNDYLRYEMMESDFMGI